MNDLIIENPEEAWRKLEISGLTGLQLNAAKEALVVRMTKERGVALTCETLNSVMGQGKDRSHLIELAFAYSNDTAEVLLKSLESLSLPSERVAAANALTHQTNLSIEDFSKLPNMSKECEDLFVNRMSLQVSSSMSRESLVVDYMQLLQRAISEGKVTPSSLPRFVSIMSLDSPFEAWDVARKLLGETYSNKIGTLETTIIKNMINQDPGLALNRIIESSPDQTMIATALDSWRTKDLKGAESWFASNKDRLDLQVRDHFCTEFARGLANTGDLLSARQWIAGIGNTESRRKAEGYLWTAERDLLRNEVVQNPAGTMQAIVSGHSKYADYWIEEAMGTWVAKDFDKAQTWYQDNWQKLPASKGQYLAAAFANQAASQGDTDTARQWAIHIQDPKTKQRIDAGIAKAEAAKNN